MVFYIGAKFDFLKLEYLLFLLRFFISFLLLISVFSVVHDTAYRRFPVRCNFYKIKTFFLRQTDGFMERHNSQLFVCIADYPYLSGTNLLIDTEFLSYSFHLRKRNSLQVKSGQHILSASEFIHKP